MAVWRSMLFIPSNSWRMIVKAAGEMQDAVILDLEGVVPVAEKETGRIFARDAAIVLKSTGTDVFVRINSFATGLTQDDLRVAVVKGVDGVVLPKAECGKDVARLDQLLRKEEERKGLKAGSISIVPLVESSAGVTNAADIAGASARVAALGFGAGHYLREMGAGLAAARLAPDEYFPIVLYARSRVSVAARVAGIPAIDTPYYGLLIDLDGLVRDASMARLLGYGGKMLNHPRHVEPVNRVFAPTREEVEHSRMMVAAYEDAAQKGVGAVSYGGRMIDFATAALGKEVIGRAEAIAAKERSSTMTRHWRAGSA